MWNNGIQQQRLRMDNSRNQQPPPPIHQHPPHHIHPSSVHNTQNTHNNNSSLHSHSHSHSNSRSHYHHQRNSSMSNTNTAPINPSQSPSLRSKDLHSWCEAFDKHELVDILVKISGTNSQFQSYLGHAFVTDIKWCKIRVTFTPSTNISNNNKHIKLQQEPPTSSQISQYFGQYGNMRQIECFPHHNSALITFENYTFAQSAVSVGVHENICNTIYNASCCYEFEGNELPQQKNQTSMYNNNNNPQQQSQSTANMGIGGPLEQRRIFVSSLSYSTSDETLENVFSQYGELEDCTIVKDKLTQRSKGYGFVVFKNVSGAVNALKQSEKFIDGRRTRSWLAAQGNQFRNRQ